jgi:hypothetical protein
MPAPETLPANFDQWDAPPSQPAQTSAAPDTLPANFNGWDSQPAKPAEEPGIMQRAGNFLQRVHEQGPIELGKGVAKGLGDTVVGSLDILNKFTPSYAMSKMGVKPAQEEQAVWDQNTTEARKLLESKNEAQSAGKGLEMVGEMLLGDAAFKGLTALEKIKELHKAAKLLEEFPTIAKILSSSARAGASAGTVETVKTGDLKQGAEAALIGGATGGLFEAGSAGVKAIAKAPKVIGGMVDSVTGKAAQKELQAGIKSVAAETAQEAEVTVAETSIRNTVRETAKSVQAKSKKLYAQLDEVTDSRFSNTDEALRDSQRQLRKIKGADDVAEERIRAKIATLESDMTDLIAMAKRGGVDPKVAEAARSSWRQSKALADVDKALQEATVGDVSVGKPETIKPTVLANKLQALYNKGRLQEAFGETQAKKMLRQAIDAKDAAASRARNLKRVKAAAPYAGGAVGALGGTAVGLKLLGGE